MLITMTTWHNYSFMVITTTVDIELLLGYLGNCWGWEWPDTPQYDTIVIFNILQYKYLNLSPFFSNYKLCPQS